MSDTNDLLQQISDAGFRVHVALAPGYLESVYKNALYLELVSLGLKVETEKPLKVKYRDKVVGFFRADMVVNDEIIIELKACRELTVEHEMQLVNYLQATNTEIGLLMNFGSYKFRVIKKTRIYRMK